MTDAAADSEPDRHDDEVDEVRRRAQEHGTLPGDRKPTYVDPDADGEIDRDPGEPLSAG